MKIKNNEGKKYGKKPCDSLVSRQGQDDRGLFGKGILGEIKLWTCKGFEQVELEFGY